MDGAQAIRAEKLRADLRKRVKQIDYIMQKVTRISTYSQFATLKVFYNRLEKKKKYFENALTTPAGWVSFESISKNERYTESLLVGNRLEVFGFEIEYEQFAIHYDKGFFGFYHPDRFLLFGIPPEYVFSRGEYGKDDYARVRSAVQNDPSLILREREKVTAYLKKGWESCPSKRRGEEFPIDLTIPEGY